MATTVNLGARTIPRMGLGTNRLTPTEANMDFIRAAAAAGLGVIDTAHLYTGGDSERTIGSAFGDASKPCIVATKGGYEHGDPATLEAEIQQSLASLKVDCIDIYYLHRVDAEIAIEDSLAALKVFQDRGQITHIGLSQVDVTQIRRAQEVASIAAVQDHYNISERAHDDVVDYCTENRIPFFPFFPLKGEFTNDMATIAKSHGCTERQIALAWLLMRSPMMVPIPGTLSLSHLRENIDALDIELTAAEFDTVGATAGSH